MAIWFEARGIWKEHHVLQRRLSVAPPAYQTRDDVNPTLLVSWFCTIFSLVIIVIRVLGRWIRNEKLFSDDKVMFWSIVPLLARMGFVHVVLRWGTNNTVTTGLSDLQIQQRVVGSKLVLPARILFATYVWIAKVTVLLFLQKLVASSWHKSYEIAMKVVYGILLGTYIASVVSTLAECQPFNHYWQVVPDPGSTCRAGLAQLVTMGVCETVTDMVLVVFPIPLVLMSGQTFKRKVSLISLFLLSLPLVAITTFRIQSTIERNASQQYRSLLASLEVLASTAVANAIVIGSFLRDRGVKKAKFRAASVDGSIVSKVATLPSARSKSITQHHWGSDEDLVRELGLSVRPDLRHGSVTTELPRPAPVAEASYAPDEVRDTRPQRPRLDTDWNFSMNKRTHRRRSSDMSSTSSSSSDIKLQELQSHMDEPVSPGTMLRPRKMSFFETGEALNRPHVATQSPVDFDTSKSEMFLSDVGGLLGPATRVQSEVISTPPEPRRSQPHTLHPRDPRRLFRSHSPFGRASSLERNESGRSRRQSRSPLRDIGPDDLDIVDAGGLLK